MEDNVVYILYQSFIFLLRFAKISSCVYLLSSSSADLSASSRAVSTPATAFSTSKDCFLQIYSVLIHRYFQYFIHHPFSPIWLPGRPHGTNASLIIGSEQLPLYSKKARNVYLFVRANTNQIKSKIVCSLSNNGLIKLTHLSYPFKKYPASCSKEKHSSFIMLFFTFFSNDSLYVFFNSIHPSISNTSCSYL